MSTTTIFDRVEVDDGAMTRSYTPAEFLALPLALRIAAVIQGRCRFLRRGELVDRQAALNELRRMSEAA